MPRIVLERRDLADNLRRLLDQLDDRQGAAWAAGECTPPCDVLERPEAIDVIMDLPGVQADTVTILVARNTLVIAGRKLPAACGHAEAAFHLAERMFGRFARVIHVTGAFDASRADAALHAGELRLTLPRIEERRGREIRVAVRAN